VPRAALYARVSTTDQRPDAQLDALRSYASARGLEAVGEHVDHGVSGAKARRPALDRLLAGARRRSFDVVVVTKLDRLAAACATS
jgi:DNA invertase Pin-like site-specific DNA recombinase